MVTSIIVPHLGEGMMEATLVEWKVKEGEWIKRGSTVLVVETAKTSWDVEAGASGYVHILIKEGKKAPVLAVVGLIAETREELEALQKEPPKEILATVAVSTEVPPVEISQGKGVA